ncbi:MAG: response regulator [bacterium]|nr:response regulator [bacterium]
MSKIKREILVIDDEPEILELLKEFLEGHQFKVRVAADGIEGQACLEEKLPGIAIIDLLLPGEHGLTLVEKIKEKYFLPVLLISSIYSREEIKTFMEEHYVEAFFEKPLDLPVMLAKIEEIIKSHEGE